MEVRARLAAWLQLAVVASCATTPRPAPAVAIASPPPSPKPPPAAIAPPPPSPSPPNASAVATELDPEMVATYINSQLPRVKACYDRSLKNKPELAGKITMRWTIDTDGATRGIDVESNSMQASPVPDCLKAVIETWRFPKPSARVEISFPFRFTSDPSEAPRPETVKTPI